MATGNDGKGHSRSATDTTDTVVVATNNPSKLAEIEAIFGEVPAFSGMSFVTIGSLGDFPDPVEDGNSFYANALIKARDALDRTGMACALAEDSGLMVDALGGAPGILSARWSGGHGNHDANNEMLLWEMRSVPDGRRRARYHACAVLVTRDGEGGESVIVGEGDCEGSIARGHRGSNGFAYDSLFVPDGFGGRHMAELTADEKNSVSHRRRALEMLASKMPEQ